MAIPTHVQSSGWVDDVSDIVTITLNSVVTGNAVFVAIVQEDVTELTYTVTDAQGNIYTQRQRAASAAVVEAWSVANVVTTAGTIVITITASAATVFSGLAVEVEAIDPGSPFDVANYLHEPSPTTSHFSAPFTAIDTTTNVYVLSVGSIVGTSGGVTPGSGWTSLGENASTHAYAQYKISADALTERGPYTTGTSRQASNIVASFNGALAIIPIVTNQFLDRRT